MELTELTPEQYATVFNHPMTPYGSVAFNLLNADKADSLYFGALTDKSGRYRLGVIAGRCGDSYRVPFSAPFGEISSAGRQKLETVATFISLLRERFGTGNMRVTLPPAFYDDVMQPRVAGCLSAAGHLDYADYNYHYELAHFDEFTSHLDANARNHLNRALRAGFEFKKTDLGEAYDVIGINRHEKGYPLRMTLDALEATSEIIPVDPFVLTLDSKPVASAIVYRLGTRVAQIIYWGHIGEYSSSHPMNLLAREVFGHYADAGFEIVDIGPSSSVGVPDMGLCTFKESLGCQLTFKPTLTV